MKLKTLAILVASAALFYCPVAFAQNSGTVTNHAFAVGKGAGKTGFTPILCADTFIPIGQTSADPVCAALSGDVTMTDTGAVSIGANKITTTMINAGAVTLAKMANTAANTVLSNWTAGSAASSANTWPACSADGVHALTYTNGTGVVCTALTTGAAGTVTNVQVAAGAGIAVSGTCTITTTGVCTVAVNQSVLTNSLSGDVALNNTANYFDGPSVAQGTSGTWWASGTVTLVDPSITSFYCKLWDGTTVIASGAISATAAFNISMSLAGYIASPAGNIRISCKDNVNTTGNIKFNVTGNSKDSTISVHRVQ